MKGDLSTPSVDVSRVTDSDNNDDIEYGNDNDGDTDNDGTW